MSVIKPIIFSFFILSGTTYSADTRPAWIDIGKDPAYPNNIYFVGVGSGEADAEAQSDALGAISRQISSDVVSVTESVDQDNNSDNSSSFKKATQTYSAKGLRNVKFAARHEADSKIYALAVLKIADYLANSDKTITELGSEVKTLGERMSSYGKESDAAVKIRAALKYRSLVSILSALTNDYRGVYVSHSKLYPGGGSHEKTSAQISELERNADDKLRRMSFTVTTKGGGLDEIAEKATSYLVKSGMPKAEKESAMFFVTITSDISYKPSPNGKLVFARGLYKLAMIDRGSGNTFFQKDTSLEGGGSSNENAAANLAHDAWTEIEKNLKSFGF